MDSLKGDFDDVRGRLNDCSDQLTAMVPATAATGPPPTSSPDPTHQGTSRDSKGIETKIKFKVALDNLRLDLADLQEDLDHGKGPPGHLRHGV